MSKRTVNTAPLDQALAEAQTRLAELADALPDLLNPPHQRHGPKRTDRVQGPVIRRQQLQLQLMRQALAVARAAAEGADVATIAADLQATVRQYGALSRLGSGWFDTRHVWRPRIEISRNAETGETTTRLVKVPFGPYVYYRWKEGGKQRSLYLGRADEPDAWVEKLEALGLDLAEIGLADLQALAVAPTPPASRVLADHLRQIAQEVTALHHELSAITRSLQGKPAIGQRDGQALITQARVLLNAYAEHARRRAVIDELARPHADEAALVSALDQIAALDAQDPQPPAWRQVLDGAAATLARGPLRREADRWALRRTATAIADAAQMHAWAAADQAIQLHARGIDATPWLVRAGVMVVVNEESAVTPQP